MASPRLAAQLPYPETKHSEPKTDNEKVTSEFETQKIEVKCEKSEPPKINSFKNDAAEKVTSPRNEVAVPIRKSSLKKVPPPIECDASPPQEPLPSPPKNIVDIPKNVLPSKVKTFPPAKEITKKYSPPKNSPPQSNSPSKVSSPPKHSSPPNHSSPPKNNSPISKEVLSPPLRNNVASPPWGKVSPLKKEMNSPSPVSYTSSPPSSILKLNKSDSQTEENIVASKVKRDSVTAKDIPKADKLSLPNNITDKIINCEANTNKAEEGNAEKSAKNEESNGVGDKIKIFEKAAEDASVNAGKLSRPGSVRGRARIDRLGSDSKEDLPPPATPFKDNIFFEIGNTDKNANEKPGNSKGLERQQSLTKGSISLAKWQCNSNSVEEKIKKPEPQKIIKPEFKPMPSPVDVTIRSPSIIGKIPEQFPSHGTAFRNVVAPDNSRSNPKPNEDTNAQFKTCKVKNKEKYSVSKGSSYFTRGSEEIWLVKKKDIEEIEERVLDSFRRAGGNLCMRSESMRPSSDGGQVSFTHATMGRNKRQMYARSESLDPQWAGNRSQTLKRQSSVACTCGHDKKTRSKSAGSDTAARPRSKSHGDDNQSHVLDKYETLV